jgi:hypothetical protein
MNAGIALTKALPVQAEDLQILFQLYADNAATEANLWMMYVAATLACAGFGITTDSEMSMPMALIACVGFVAFATGQFLMVKDIIQVREIIFEQLRRADNHPLQSLIIGVTRFKLTVRGAVMTHLVVDACIVALIVFKPMGKIAIG